MTLALLSLGSNLGDRLHTLRQAVERLRADVRTQHLCVSPVYETAPMEITDQPDFLNMAVRCEWTGTPEALLQLAQRIEQELGRVRTVRYGPRTVDIDLLLFGDEQRTREDLIIPHPRMRERAFVLVPLRDIAPDVRHPEDGSTIIELAENVEHTGSVALWGTL